MKQALPCMLPVLALLLAGCEARMESAAAPPNAQQAQPPAETETAPAPSVAAPQLARGNLNFVDGYARGLALAQSTHKPMLVFFTAEWCRFCHQMADEAFTQPQVVALAEHFVCVLVDADAHPDVCRQFRVQAFPTVQFVSSRGVPLNRVVGKKPGHQLMMSMQAALQSVARRPAAAEVERSL